MRFCPLDFNALERQLAPRRLQALDEVGGADEQDAPAVLDESQRDRRT
jgi:hypothetical protein